MGNISTKQKVMDAASILFYQKGFDGTSVRDIAHKAAVNVSLISYYFKGKQGLLEHVVTYYYESYLQMMEQTIAAYENDSPFECMSKLVHDLLYYRMENYQLSAFIQRELTIDSTFVREMAVTYLAKENHLLGHLFYSLLPEKRKKDRKLLFMQWQGMLLSPFNLKVEWETTMIDQVSRLQFVEKYTKTLTEWLTYLQNG